MLDFPDWYVALVLYGPWVGGAVVLAALGLGLRLWLKGKQ